jgi:hypothetical protein
MRSRCLLALLLIVVATVTGAAAEESTDEVLARVARAYGGAMIVAQTRAIKMRGTTHSVMRGTSGPIARAYQHPDRLMVEIAYSGRSPERRVMVGDRGWRQGQPVRGPFHSSMVLQASRMALPRILFERRDVLIDHRVGKSPDSEPARRFEIPLDDGLVMFVDVDPQTGHILRSRGVMRMGDKAMEFGTAYEDLRMREGRLVAFREIHLVSGKTTGITEISEITFPDSLPDSMFSP